MCNLGVGAPADGRQAGHPHCRSCLDRPSPAVGGGPQQPGQARKIKLSAVVDPTLDAEIIPIPEAEVTQMYDQYRQRFGDYPTADTDVSRDQLEALRQVVQAGAIPYADFSIFGPYMASASSESSPSWPIT